MRRTDPDFRRQLDGYSLATAEIFYLMPDARSLLQTYVWQDYDMAPRFPNLRKFLDFWTRELDGQITPRSRSNTSRTAACCTTC